MKQDPTAAEHRAVVGIPVVHGREDVKPYSRAFIQPWVLVVTLRWS